MPSQFTANSIRLDQLFADPFLIEAPAYQRHFAWGAQEAGRLLDDVSEAADGGEDGIDHADYFLGTMLLIDRDRGGQDKPGWPLSGPPRPFEVVDGLQRLTTLTILFCVLRDLYAEDGEPADTRVQAAIGPWQEASGHNRLTLRGADQSFFLDRVRRPGSCLAAPESSDLSPAEEHIIEVRNHFVGALADLEAAERRRLADFLLTRCYVVLIATTGIDRAYRMFRVLNETGKPLARNDILKAELLGSVPPAAAAAATDAWEEAEQRLGHDFESLFSNVRAMYGRPGAHVIGGIRTIASESGGAEAFIHNVLLPAARVQDDVRNARHEGSAHSAAICRTLGHLRRLAAHDWMPATMLWWMRKGKNSAELSRFLSAMDRLAHGLRIAGLSAARRARRFGTLITAIRSGHDLKSSPNPLELTNEELRSIDFNLRNLHARSAPTAKLLLMRLSEQIAGRAEAIDAARFTVEHVLPRKIGAGSQWRGWFPEPEERQQCVHSLGNLLLVTREQNDRAGNLEFARKQAVYFDTPDVTVPALNESLRELIEWSPARVKAREAELLQAVQALWGFGTGTAQRGGALQGRRKRTKAA